MVNITINDKTIAVPEGITVLRAAEQAGITIPTLCDHPDLTPYGGCRLCVVDVEGARVPQTSCTLPVREGMVVHTETPELVESRKTILELFLSNYVDSGYTADDREDNELIRWAKHYDVGLPKGFDKPEPRFAVDSDPNPFVWVDRNKCILCTRCIRACAEVQGRFVWGLAERGYDSHLVAGASGTMLDAMCESCGACAAYCPTGALDDKMSIKYGRPDRKVTTTCSFCGVGCQFDLNVKDDKIIRVTSNPEAPVNGMSLCVKGRYGYDYVHHEDRLSRPLVRAGLLEGAKDSTPRRRLTRQDFVEVDWDTALDLVSTQFADIKREAGSDALAVLASAKCTNEENFLFNKFSRQVLGTNNLDHCARL